MHVVGGGLVRMFNYSKASYNTSELRERAV